jgi:hypothetical protein
MGDEAISSLCLSPDRVGVAQPRRGVSASSSLERIVDSSVWTDTDTMLASESVSGSLDDAESVGISLLGRVCWPVVCAVGFGGWSSSEKRLELALTTLPSLLTRPKREFTEIVLRGSGTAEASTCAGRAATLSVLVRRSGLGPVGCWRDTSQAACLPLGDAVEEDSTKGSSSSSSLPSHCRLGLGSSGSPTLYNVDSELDASLSSDLLLRRRCGDNEREGACCRGILCGDMFVVDVGLCWPPPCCASHSLPRASWLGLAAPPGSCSSCAARFRRL